MNGTIKRLEEKRQQNAQQQAMALEIEKLQEQVNARVTNARLAMSRMATDLLIARGQASNTDGLKPEYIEVAIKDAYAIVDAADARANLIREEGQLKQLEAQKKAQAAEAEAQKQKDMAVADALLKAASH